MTLPVHTTSPTRPTTARSHLFNEGTVDDYRAAVAAGVDRVARRVTEVTGPFTGVRPDQVAPLVDAVDLDRPLPDTAAALDELEQVYLRDAVYFHHPRYLAHLNCPVVIPALVGEAVLSAVNSSLDTWDQSAGGTLIERRLIDWTAARIGLGPAADGVFTSGGTQSNLHALLLAREEALAGATPTDRRILLPRLRIVTSAAGHFSVQKAAKLLGLAPDAVVVVQTGPDRRMRAGAVRHELARCRRDGLPVLAVVATAGTTDFGTIDPLDEIAEVCATAGTWLHVDAAYGCGLLVSPTRRHLLDGIERADSVTVDYHKSFFQPVSSSAVLVRDRRTLRHATWHADYLNPARMVAARIPNQVDKSLQTTRRFDALKLWLTLRVMGPDAVGELFDEVCDRAAQAWELAAADPRFEVLTRSPLSTVVFRWRPAGTPAELADAANLHAREALAASGLAVVAGTRVDGRQHLKFTVLNPATTVEDVAGVLDLIAEHAGRYAHTHAAARSAELTCPVG
ncbi:pyridoxal phosphate-dependent decarboxylase family protein [Micromonospora endophytica]|uniref:Pyridoxal-dependent decarboxylase n=1 Tax=Micromonospora endophytica TaxID=515350 RepID=A0A2W2CKH1_9ACTN|nr:aspartate aminotransferase family protein [Micromonospora endophytica]PZF99915.1 pyridoxal-dependent decarboxylase [Micromonospora endophytica]RIW49503.1 aminotransferase class V-fold PLP-dependent enzyme [Micromonospora endophytica]BCJ62539.1 pyridoxal-dependent decarboxylase [Micromonospora endophytica]